MDIILASTSPRRHQLLALADIDFSCLGVDVDETIFPDECPQHYILRMVQSKAQQACQMLNDSHKIVDQDKADYHQDDQLQSNQTQSKPTQQINYQLIITADTIGVLADGHSIMVKPLDKADAFAMWQQMSDTEHTIWTAVKLILIDNHGKTHHQVSLLEKTIVKFIALDKMMMQAYWETGEPQDKAGGYAIQGKGAVWVERINGSYSNVVGLPLAQTVAAIQQIQAKIK